MCPAIIIVLLINAVSEAMACEILHIASLSRSKTALKMFFSEFYTEDKNK